MRVTKKVETEYTITLDRFEYEQLMLALRYAYEHALSMSPRPGNTTFGKLHDELGVNL